MEYRFALFTFHPRADNAQPLVQPGEGLFSLRRVPFSSAAILDLGGVSSAQMYGPIEILIDPGDVSAFEALYATQASSELVVNDVTYSRATLVACRNKTQTPHGDKVSIEAQWVVG